MNQCVNKMKYLFSKDTTKGGSIVFFISIDFSVIPNGSTLIADYE